MSIDYLSHLAQDSQRFAEVLTSLDKDTRVPSCPDWNVSDLVWHLAEVQHFWARIVGERCLDPRSIKAPNLVRPGGWADLRQLGLKQSSALLEALRQTPPETPAWTWSAEQTAGFSYRRQAHEALIHRVDAELAASDRTPLDVDLATDGIDEALRIMLSRGPDWAELTAQADSTARIQATDTGASWVVGLGRFVGTSPKGRRFDEPTLILHDDVDQAVSATITSTAGDLDCWLWNRPCLGELSRDGDQSALDRVQEVIAVGIT